MMGDELFNIDPEGLDENGKKILTETKKIEEALRDIADAKKQLEGWVSPNKEKYETKLNTVLPKMSEMVEALNMYGNTATNTAERVKNSEAMVASRIENDLLG